MRVLEKKLPQRTDRVAWTELLKPFANLPALWPMFREERLADNLFQPSMVVVMGVNVVGDDESERETRVAMLGLVSDVVHSRRGQIRLGIALTLISYVISGYLKMLC